MWNLENRINIHVSPTYISMSGFFTWPRVGGMECEKSLSKGTTPRGID